MDEYYKFYESYRFKHVANAKLAQQNRSIRKNFYFFFICLIIFLLALPYLQFIYQFIHPPSFELYDNKHKVFFYKRILPFTLIGTFTLIYSFIGSILISRNRTPDQFKKIMLFNKSAYQIGLFFTTCVIINGSIIYFLDNNLSDIFRDLTFEPNVYLRLLFLFIPMFMYTSIIFFVMGVFVMSLNRIKIEIQNQRKTREDKANKKDMDTDKSEKYVYIYWVYFIKNLIINQPIGLVGAIVFITLTMIAFIVRGGNIGLFHHHFIWSVAFYSFWITSANLTLNPIFNGIRNLNKIYNEYSLHIINNSILPKLVNHIVIIGAGNLGKQIIRNCFTDIHPEGYGVSSLCMQGDDKVSKPIPSVEDYDIIIDKDLSIHTISRRIVVIDKDSNIYKERFKTVGDIPIVTFEPWADDSIPMALIGICGDANNEYILNSVAINKAEVIINATPDSNLSLLLASKYQGKQLLSVNDSYTFDTLTATTYDRDVFLIDTQSIEGTNLSQLIFHWAYLNIRNNINRKFANISGPAMINNLKESKVFDNCKNRYEYKKDNTTIYDTQIIKYCIAMHGNGRVLLCGSGRYFFHIIKSLILQMKFEMELTDTMVRNIIQNKIFILTDDKRILAETVKESCDIPESKYWKFYPIRDKNTEYDSAFKIKLYKGKANNFEKYVEVLNSCVKYPDSKKLFPELIVLINSDAYTSIDMFISASTAIEIVKNSLPKEKVNFYKPHLLVYSNRTDKFYLNEHFKKYYSFDFNRTEKVGYPTQLMKESRLTKDFGGALQYTSMLKAMYISTEDNSKHDEEKERLAEVTFSVYDIPGSLAYIAASLIGRRLNYGDNYNNNKLKVPSFINYFTAEEIRYKDTFLFKGFAKLDSAKKIDSFEDLVKYCFINCDDKHLKDIRTVLNDNINNKSYDNLKEIIKSDFDKGTFSHYPISSILRHSDKHYDILKRRPRFFSYRKRDEKKYTSTKQCEIQSKIDLMLLFNVSDFTIWAEGEENAGSLASVLSQTVLARVEDNGHKCTDLNQCYEPLILFSSNKPSLEIINNYDNSIKQNISQDSFYIKLREKHRENVPDYSLIRAIKIKISGKIFLKNLEWSKYIFNLIKHLNETSKNHLDDTSKLNYSLFLIEKTYIEGLESESPEGVIEKSVYKIVYTDKDIEYGGRPFFKITRKWNYDSIKPRELPYLDFINLSDNKSDTDSSQGYEFVIIRNNIIDYAKEEFIRKLNYGSFENMLYFIDDI